MHISRTKFIILFMIAGFAFMGVTTSLLGTTGPRGFPQLPDSVLHTGSDSPIAWKRTVSAIVFPVKAVLLGPVMPYFNLLRQEPDTPPPFFGIGLLVYWTVLASGIHHTVGKLRHS